MKINKNDLLEQYSEYKYFSEQELQILTDYINLHLNSKKNVDYCRKMYKEKFSDEVIIKNPALQFLRAHFYNHGWRYNRNSLNSHIKGCSRLAVNYSYKEIRLLLGTIYGRSRLNSWGKGLENMIVNHDLIEIEDYCKQIKPGFTSELLSASGIGLAITAYKRNPNQENLKRIRAWVDIDIFNVEDFEYASKICKIFRLKNTRWYPIYEMFEPILLMDELIKKT